MGAATGLTFTTFLEGGAGFQFFEPALQQFAPPQEERLPSEVAELYRQLHAVAFYPPEIQRTFSLARRAA